MKNMQLSVIIMLLMLPVMVYADRPGSKPIRGSGKILEQGVEGPFYGFYLGNDLHGHVKTKFCQTELRCKEIVYKITPEVRATLDENEVPLAQFIMSKQQPTTLHLDTDTGKLSRIGWSSAVISGKK